jgi:hypothetical protein
MTKTALSLAPLSAEIVKLLIRQTPDVPDFEAIPGNEMSEEKVKKSFSEADVVLGDYTFKQKSTADIVSAARNLSSFSSPAWAIST